MNNWTKNQYDIYKGLSYIGEEIAGFYKSALNFYYNHSLPNVAYYLAHAAREIDGALRDSFSSEINKKIIEESLIKQKLDEILGIKDKKIEKNIVSILATLNISCPNKLSKKWIKVSKLFHKYAHRHGAWKKSRRIEEFIPYWDEYEEILYELIGSFYAIIERLETLMCIKGYDKASLGVLNNLLNYKYFYNYFWSKLSNYSLFNFLEEWFFSSTIQFENDFTQFWSPLYYLEKVSIQVKENPDKLIDYGEKLLKIINDIIEFSNARKQENKTPINNSHIWWYIVKILNNIPNNIIFNFDKNNPKFDFWIKEISSLSDYGDLAVTEILQFTLPKFLNKSMHIFSELIIKNFVTIKKLEKNDNHFDSKNAKLLVSNYWLQEAFKKNNNDIVKHCDISVIDHLLDTLNLSLEYHTEIKSIDFKIDNNNFSRLRLKRKEEDSLKEGEIGYIDGCFIGNIQKYEHKKPIENSFSELIQEDELEKKGVPIDFTLDNVSDESDFISKLKNMCINGELKDLNLDKCNEFDDNIEYFYESFNKDFSYIWYSDLNNDSSNIGNDAHDILSKIIKNLFLGLYNSSLEDSKNMFKKIINSKKYKFSIFKRIILFVINDNWVNFNDLFRLILEKNPELFETSDYKVELNNIFKNHSHKLSADVIAIIKKNIFDNNPKWFSKKTGLIKPEEKDLNYWRYEYSTMLKDISPFNNYYNIFKKEFSNIPEPKIEAKDFELQEIKSNSPLSKEEILQKTVFDIVQFFNDFKGIDSEFELLNGKTDKIGLAEAFENAVSEDPKRYENEINKFDNVQIIYAIHLISGFKEAWKKKTIINWTMILSFCENYIKNHKSNTVSDHWKGIRSCKDFAEETAKLIEVGSRDDNFSFDNSIINKANDLFEIIISTFMPFEKQSRQKNHEANPLNYAINTFPGKIIESFIVFSLHVKRIDAKNNCLKNWGKIKFERFFKDIDEGYIFFGRYLPNMMFLDKDWMLNKISELNLLGYNNPNWIDFFTSYLCGTSIYKELYDSLKPSYETAIKNKILHNEIDERLVNHITIGYLRDYEKLNDVNSLFNLILNDALNEEDKKSRWQIAASFMWSVTGKHDEKDQNIKLPEKFKDKIIDFWAYVYDKKSELAEKLGLDYYGSFLCALSELTIVLDEIGEKEKTWLLECAPYVDKRFNVNFLIEYFLKFTGLDNIKNIAEIYKEILKYYTPTYEKENIEELVDRIYQYDINSAKEIVETYARRGQHFLRDLWEKYNKQ